MLLSGPRGTKDILPAKSANWQYIEQTVRDICRLYGFKEIRTPVFEHTELFLRGIGETTDIVSKEMYTFVDRGERSLTLRPENTAAVVRAYLEHKLYAESILTKLFYIGPMFRYDRPQAGRYRQFHQFGVEALGSKGPGVDAEVIILAVQLLERLGLSDLNLYLNSVGCPECRPVYRTALQEYLREKTENLCIDCQSRFDRNPMRILDCKNPSCAEESAGAPHIVDCLCNDCSTHFEQLKSLLTVAGIPFTLNPRLVRGLDYYTKTAFEIQYAALGSQSAVCGGGRYDGLVAECGGQSTPSIGFAIGLERILLVLEMQGLLPEVTNEIDVFVVTIGKETKEIAFKFLCDLRKNGLTADMDFMDKNIKGQMKQANKYPARFVAIIGDDEAEQGNVMLKNMQSGVQELVAMSAVQNKIQVEMED